MKPLRQMATLLLLVPWATTVAAQRPPRLEIAGVTEVIVTDYEEGSLAFGGRLGWLLTPRFAIDAQVTYGTVLGDGDEGDLLATVGIRANAYVRSAVLSVSVRPGVLSCADGDCGMATETGSFPTVYAGVAVTSSATRRVFLRADVGDYVQSARAHGARGVDHNRTLGFSLGVRL